MHVCYNIPMCHVFKFKSLYPTHCATAELYNVLFATQGATFHFELKRVNCNLVESGNPTKKTYSSNYKVYEISMRR